LPLRSSREHACYFPALWVNLNYAKPNPDPEKLISILEVLQQKWPSKQAEIELAVRKLQIELGLVPLGEQ
jgi:hypothetical protein